MIPFIFFAAMLVLLWLLVLQPQRRRRQQLAQTQAELATGDEVMTLGGLFGTVSEVAEHHVVLEIAPETLVRVAKSAVTARLEPETEPATTPETPLT